MRDALRIAGIALPNGAGFSPCPFHDDSKPSLHLVGAKGRETGYKCFGCGAAGGILDFLVEARIATDHAQAAQLLEERMGESRPQSAVVASFIYDDGDGNPVARIDRIEPGRNGRAKDFYPYPATDDGFAERPGLNGTRLPLYRRGEVLDAGRCNGTIFLVEGERKGDRLREAPEQAVAEQRLQRSRAVRTRRSARIMLPTSQAQRWSSSSQTQTLQAGPQRSYEGAASLELTARSTFGLSIAIPIEMTALTSRIGSPRAIPSSS